MDAESQDQGMDCEPRKSIRYKLVRETKRVLNQIRSLGKPGRLSALVYTAPVGAQDRPLVVQPTGHNSPIGRRVLIMIGEAEGTFYNYQGRALCRALENIGANGYQLRTPRALKIDQLPPESILDAIHRYGATDVMTINIPPAVALRGAPLPAGVLWHTWVQDLFDAGLHTPRAEGEVRWNWVKRWGEPYLLPATEHGRFYQDPDGYDVDVCFCGLYATEPLRLRGAPRKQRRIGARIMREVYALWEKDVFNYRTDWKQVHELWTAAEERAGVKIGPSCLGACLHHIACQATRQSQRQRMARAAVSICRKRKWRLALFGLNWESDFAAYAKGNLAPGFPLARVFQRSKINIQLNGDTLFHNRLLEIFAAGGFGLSWVPGETDDEGLKIPLTDLKRFEADLEYWIGNEGQRRDEISRIGEQVRGHHTYEARMRKMLGLNTGDLAQAGIGASGRR